MKGYKCKGFQGYFLIVDFIEGDAISQSHHYGCCGFLIAYFSRYFPEIGNLRTRLTYCLIRSQVSAYFGKLSRICNKRLLASVSLLNESTVTL
jgi:hypothetical protein